MINYILSLVAPHHCCGCDKIGSLLCGNCKYNIISESKMVCIACNQPTNSMWLCNTCKLPYQKAWAVGEREDTLQRLVGLYKFQRVKSAYKDIAGLLLDILPELPADTVIVPVPTVSGHIRERGYDHMLLIAKHIAKARGLQCQRLLYRKTNTKQRQATAAQRVAQAKCAFGVMGQIEAERPYLVLDDVITTGATVKYASRALSEAGAKHVWVAIVARQTID